MYYILTSKYAEEPIFCVKEPALKILEALAKVEEYFLLHHMDEHKFTTLVEILEYMEEVEYSIFDNYWFDIYGGDIAGSEEPVEATYDTDKVIDIYASGVDFLEAQETCISENFPFDEVYIPPPAKKESYAWLNFLFPLVISLIIIGIFSDL